MWTIINDNNEVFMIHKPKHPGLMVKSLCLEPLKLSVTDAAIALGISRPTLSKLVNGRMGISPEMAERLSIVFNTSDEMWINLQAKYDLYLAHQYRSRLKLKPLAILKTIFA
jgi:addiction module HigA family antidote